MQTPSMLMMFTWRPIIFMISISCTKQTVFECTTLITAEDYVYNSMFLLDHTVNRSIDDLDEVDHLRVCVSLLEHLDGDSDGLPGGRADDEAAAGRHGLDDTAL